MTTDIKETLRLHKLFVDGEVGGVRANLSGANLSGADLYGADLYGANLRWANLSGANLSGANLRWANLSGANLSGANLSGANLYEADLYGANLRWANLYEADLRGADLYGANLRGATGNMREVKSAQFDKWPITWTCSADGVTTLQIGCQRHPLDLWIKSDPRWIAALDRDATEWWAKYRDVVLTLVAASPAVPHGGKHD